jgi:hypothetical protein
MAGMRFVQTGTIWKFGVEPIPWNLFLLCNKLFAVAVNSSR